MKQTFRLRESELKRMIAESVKRVLNEEHGGTYIQGVLQAIEDAIYSTVDSEIARLAVGDRLNMMKQTLVEFVEISDHLQTRPMVLQNIYGKSTHYWALLSLYY